MRPERHTASATYVNPKMHNWIVTCSHICDTYLDLTDLLELGTC